MTYQNLLPATEDLRDYLRIETSAEDELIADLLEQVVGEIESICGKCLTTETVTWIDDAKSNRTYGSPRALLLRYTPIDATTVVVKANDGTTVDPSQYVVRQDLQQIVGVQGYPTWDDSYLFDSGPYTITCTAGFATSPTYATRESRQIKRVVLDFAAYYYRQRSPGARTERAASTSVDWDIDPELGIPRRIARAIRQIRGPVIVTV